ncbi:MAG: nickel pincer cofactor biosynthesis protein LarC [Kiritimatiellae bacterium]|nr:nickel pincer cofactor biosynthesis protein LarC [Kiritimatiellia bacterium]
MKNILYYNCFAGISGDMHLGAMLDLGVPVDHLIGELKKLHLDGYEIKVSTDKRQGIAGTRAEVITRESHHHRGLHAISDIINQSSLSDTIKASSLDIFHKLAEAEASVHNVEIENIHFHEVGAIDAMVDIVGAAICIDYLKPDFIYSSPIELGGGFAECAHGTFPIPAPATVELLKGIPVTTGGVHYEATTPTGAAILASVVDEFIETANLTITKTGYGIGFKDEKELPNVLRVNTAQMTSGAFKEETGALIIECNIDDMNPEYYDHIFDRLFDAGAKDVFMTPIIMKKSRPAITLSVLCHTDIEQQIERIILMETSSLGLRKYPVRKSVLDRKTEIISTEYGEVRVKTALYEGKKVRSKPEHDDCKKIAQESGLALNKVYALVERLIHEQ